MNTSTMITSMTNKNINEQLLSIYKEHKEHKKVKKILMIEDDLDMSEVISDALKAKYACRVDVAQDPFEAMDLMTENFYDLIILDWQLPALNGSETLVQAEKVLYLEPSLPIQWDQKKVPVVLFSSSAKAECPVRRTKHFNYVGFISKFQPLDVLLDLFGIYIEEDPRYRYGTA